MYKVFRDPEGKRSLDHTDTPNSSSINTNKIPTLQQSDELETYKLRIQTLNFEIKRLNDELEMVTVLLVFIKSFLFQLFACMCI